MAVNQDFQSTSSHRSTGQHTRLKQGAALLTVLLFLTDLAGCVAKTNGGPSVPTVAALLDADGYPTPTSTPEPTVTSPVPSPSPTLMPLPTVPSTVTSGVVKLLAAIATPSQTATFPPSPSPTRTPSRTPTPTNTPTPKVEPTPVATTAFSEDILNVLLIGGDQDYVLDMNTDTLIIAAINLKTKQVSLLSIPRDLWVYIPTYGWGRINVAHRIGERFKYSDGRGPGLLMRTIEENLGVPIDHWVRIGYEGFARGVDELGGVDMIVPCPVNLRYKRPTSEEQQEMILPPGLHHLDGATALRYVRTRRGDSDFEREHRQQQFLKAVWHQLRSPEVVLKIPSLWSAMKGGFATDLTLGDILGLAPLALDLQPQRIRSRYIGRTQVQSWTTAEGWSVLIPIPEKVQQVVESLYWPPPADQDTVANESVRVEVRNGTARSELSLIAADQLSWQGFSVVDRGAADRSDYQKSEIIVFNEKPGALALLTSVLGVWGEEIIQQPDSGQPADILVILGADYAPCR